MEGSKIKHDLKEGSVELWPSVADKFNNIVALYKSSALLLGFSLVENEICICK